MTAALHAEHSVTSWLLHLIVASTVWHLIGRLVDAHPIAAVLVGGVALVALVVLHRRWSIVR
jgi:hypothetical protein